MRRGRTVQASLFVAAVLVAATPALAHDLAGQHGKFLGSFLHPLMSLDHGLAILSTGLLAGQQRRPATRRLLAAFVAALTLGAGLPLFVGGEGPGGMLTLINIGSVIVLGVLVAWAYPLPTPVLGVVVAAVGLTHGFENVADVGEGGRSFASVAGVAAAGLVGGGVAAALSAAANGRARDGSPDRHEAPAWPGIAVRVAGSWAAAVGLMMLGLELR